MRQTTSQTVKFHAHVRNVEVSTRAAMPAEPKAPASVTQVEEVAPPSSSHVEAIQLASLLDAIIDRLEDISHARSQSFTELQEIAIELGVAIASHLVKSKLDAGEFNLERLVRQAIDQLLPAGRINVRVNPADLDDLQRALNEPNEDLLRRIDLKEDPKLPRGSCFVGTSDHGLLSSFEARLENIRETLLQGIQYARIERRKTIDVDGSLRRFPDRRKPA